ncbi:hypothetical protein DB31_4657 [Hyalangium minutum]|uniref:Uncharacterized protein n=1 Tax=Hyalangium minutum TaxID=394096 RepID=A0A085VZ81_9BACT|nr:hypothetical protein DB31_4657 [Hyalangium minutum]
MPYRSWVFLALLGLAGVSSTEEATPPEATPTQAKPPPTNWTAAKQTGG